MTPSQVLEAVGRWQSAQASDADRKIGQLTATLDDLTDLAKTRNGARIIKANRRAIKDALIKLHDLFLDTQPVESVA